MLSKHFEPLEIDGHLFDKGMILYEFDALREPEASQFPKIGELIKSRTQMVQVSTPKMFWNGMFFPDLFISNKLSELKEYMDGISDIWPTHRDGDDYSDPRNKSNWHDALPLMSVSIENHGVWFHNTFIEPMCQKITRRSSAHICAKYHRAAWLPIYWSETLRTGKDLDTKFYYPKAGYAGAALEWFPEFKKQPAGDFEREVVDLTFVIGKPKQPFSVLFVVDHPNIYRITDQDECAQTGNDLHRFVIESGGALSPGVDLRQFFDIYKILQRKFIHMPIPTIRNVALGWKPGPNMNQMLWGITNGTN